MNGIDQLESSGAPDFYRTASWNAVPTRVKNFQLENENDYRLIRPLTYTNWRGDTRQGNFHRQGNAYDCGPCMIANLNSALGKQFPDLANVSSVRTALVNFMGRDPNPQRLLSLESDIIPLLRNFGFDVYTTLNPGLYTDSRLRSKLDYNQTIKNFYSGNISALICFDPRIRHFKTFVPTF